MEKQKRPISLPGKTLRLRTGCGSMYVTVTFKDGVPFEVFGVLGKAGQCARCYAEGLTRCVTAGLRHGVPIEAFVKQLSNIACPSPGLDEGRKILSCPDAISQAIVMTLEAEHERNDSSPVT